MKNLISRFLFERKLRINQAQIQYIIDERMMFVIMEAKLERENGVLRSMILDTYIESRK